jgi:hypothetical protein
MALTVTQKFEQDWADMVDDEPFICNDHPVSTELSRSLLLFELTKPPEVCKPPVKVAAVVEQNCALPTGDQTRGLIPQTDAKTAKTATIVRTPLSAKSRPFAPPQFFPGFYQTVAPACPVALGAPTKPMNDKVKADVKTAEEEYTTVMLCGFPLKYSRDKLIDLLDVLGYAGQFDFVYLPMDFEFSESIGYAFVNMTSAAAALRLKGSFDGFVGHPFADDKPCRTNWSRVQGLGPNVKQYRNSPIMHKLVPDEFKPVLFWNGQQQPFPEPTAALKQLRPHRKKDKTLGDQKALHD